MALHRLRWTDPFPEAVRRGAVSFGNFDGVHTGHQLLMQAVVKWAKQCGGPAVAVTFDPPPVALLNPAALKLPLTTIEQRADLLHAAEADHVIALVSEPALLALSPPAFMEDVIQQQLEARALVEGSNFRFARSRAGTNADLKTFADRNNVNFEEIIVPADGVSSSKVRDAINAGDMPAATALLGRPYSITGLVVEGAKRGRSIGVPTANLDGVPTVVPLIGVYAGIMTMNHVNYATAVNIGPNPTFGEDARKIEAHILDFDGDLYGRSLTIQFHHRLRDTKPFANVAALTAQLQLDIKATKQVLA